ncbi:MAG: GNAT family N-acetyltransferase [Pseudomonadota bacterium]
MTLLPHETPPPLGPAATLAQAFRALVPVIETERLVLRAPDIGDFPLHAEICTGPRGIGLGGPLTREDAWYDFAQINATWLLRGHGYWTVTERTSGAAIGFVGIGFEPGDREPELGYFFAAEAEGRSLAAEAAGAARDQGFGPLGLVSLVSYIFKTNARSIALARRLGAVEDTPSDWEHVDCLVYRHPHPGAHA